MPITSSQVSGMIGGQHAMFGNYASYARQITPGYGGPPPTYQNPMMGAGEAFQPAPPPTGYDAQYGQEMGPRVMSAVGNVGLPAMAGAAMLGGAFLPGMAGRMLGGLDPITSGYRGFRGAIGGFGAGNLGRIASGGIGSIARAGLAGIGGAAAAALPLYAVGKGVQYGVGQMVEGAQYQNQVQNVLNQQFRHVNPMSTTGFGFSREEGAGISGMMREMGHKDMMTTPQELLRVMQQGTQMGVFRAVQDARDFKKRFTEMVGALKEVSKVMNTTLEGALPFFQSAKQMGFWTPQDIQRSAATVHGVAATTGMSVAQVQSMMGQGAQMARQVGALGVTGAQGMQRAMGLVGGGLRGGAISEQELSEATGGLQGAEAIQSFAGTMQAATTRFAAGRQGRWVLAALGGKGFRGFDPARLQMMKSGMMGLGEIGGLARRNIGKEGAFNFVMNEEDLRGELLKQGPEAQLGFIQSIAGKHLYGEGARSQYITRRLMKRYFGVGGRQADVIARLAREAPRLFEQNQARTAEGMDALERQREDVMNDSWEGLKRKASTWWDSNIKEPLQRFGADISHQIGGWWERVTDKFWGRSPRSMRFRGMDRHAMQSLQMSALGNTRAMEEAFGTPGSAESVLGGRAGGTLGEVGPQTGFGWSMRGQGGVMGGLKNAFLTDRGMGGSATNDAIESMRRLGYREYAFGTERERSAAVQRGEVVAGAWRGGAAGGAFRAFSTANYQQATAGLAAAGGGIGGLTQTGATTGLGFGGLGEAKTALQAAQKEMGETSFMQAAMQIRESMGATATGAARAQRLIQMVRSGEAGGAALRRLVGDERGVTVQQAMFRLSAAQSAEQRSGRAAIDLSEEQKGLLGAEIGDARGIERRLAEKMEESVGNLAAITSATGHGIADPIKAKGHQRVIMDLFNKDRSGEYKRGLRLMTAGRTPEERAKNRATARKIFTELSSNKEFNEEEANILRRMGDENDPMRAAIQKVAGDMGAVSQAQSRYGTNEMIMRRMRRLQGSMGEDQEKILEGLNRISMDKGGGVKGGLGEHVRGMMKRGMGDWSPEQLGKDINDITRAAMEGDEETVAAAAAQLEGMPGAEIITTGLKAGMLAKKASKALTGKRRFEQIGAASELMRGLGTDITREELKALQKDSSGKVQDQILGRIHGEDQRRNAQILLEGIKGGKLEKVLEAGLASARSRAAAAAGDPDKGLQRQLKAGIEAGTWAGQLGSTKGIHADVMLIRDSLRKIAESPGITGKKAVEAPSGGSEKPS